jgi:hypothetical protein
MGIGQPPKDRRELSREGVKLLHGRQREPNEAFDVLGTIPSAGGHALGELGRFELQLEQFLQRSVAQSFGERRERRRCIVVE